MENLPLALVGFGNVGKALACLLLRKREELKIDYGLTFSITGIATRQHGIAIDPGGLDLDEVVRAAQTGQSLACFSRMPALDSILEFIHLVPARVLFENTPVNHQTGQPAIDYIHAALEAGMHPITANKGPVAHGYRALKELAEQKGTRFLFESAVMDGAPIFSLFRTALPALQVKGFHGILNSCTNLILGQMEEGLSFEEALVYAHSLGLTETDPSADIDGWDAAIKVAILVTVLMGESLLPQQVERNGIRAIAMQDIAEACRSGKRWKLVCRAWRDQKGLHGRVAPELVTPESPLYSINGSSSYVQFETDCLSGLGIVESDPGPETTAYGLLADLLNVVRGM